MGSIVLGRLVTFQGCHALLFQFRSLITSLVVCSLRYEGSLVVALCNSHLLNENALRHGLEKMMVISF
jgi:hypothetical protein